MRKLFLLFLPLFAASCGQVKQQASAPEPVNVMSFNIRYDNPEDSLDNWQYRKDRAANAIRFYDVDILGTQEVLHNQLEDLKQRLPEYGVIGVGREDGKEKGEYSALWYKKDRFNLLDSGYFWLSETPEVAGSKGWDGACERIASSCGQVKQQASAPEPVNVMSFNIRYDNPEDSLDNWQYRKDRAANAIRFYDVDILGTQEVLHNQLEDLKQRLPEYGVIGVGREDGKEKGEYSALWYKKDRFNLLDSGYFWLSETPEVAGSKGWDGACERIASWAKLQDKVSGKEFFALNTHLDHVGVAARREGISLMLDKVNELSGNLPVVVTGDFNASPESDVIKHVTDPSNPEHLTDARQASAIVYGPAWSFHDFGKIPYDKRPLIDYVFVRNGLKVLRYGVLAETENNAFLSDHAPILVTVE